MLGVVAVMVLLVVAPRTLLLLVEVAVAGPLGLLGALGLVE
jgi:hypothetical protein